jgi:hypothetical protein
MIFFAFLWITYKTRIFMVLINFLSNCQVAYKKTKNLVCNKDISNKRCGNNDHIIIHQPRNTKHKLKAQVENIFINVFGFIIHQNGISDFQ